MKRRARWLALALGAVNCADITLPDRDQCGNAVLEANEDCDTHADARLGPGLACRSCRYSCSDGAACPTGWHCDADESCHHATGRFALAPGSPFDFASNEIVTGDVDGDSSIDVAAFVGDAIVVRFGAGDGSLSAIATQRFPEPRTGRIGAGELSGDGRLDAVIPTRRGLSVLLGRQDRSAETVAYAPYSFPRSMLEPWLIPVHTLECTPEHVYALLRGGLRAGTGPAELTLSLVLVPEIQADRGLHTFDAEARTPALLGTRIPVLDIDRQPGEDRVDELVLAFSGDSELRLCTSRDNDFNPPKDCGPPCTYVACQVIDLPAGHLVGAHDDGDRGVDATARFADADGDGHQDLLVFARRESDGTDRVLVAPGNGTRELAPLAVDSRFDELAVRWPLVAEDLNADGIADYVTADGVYFAAAEPAAGRRLDLVVPRPSLEDWREAVTGDFDRDGDRDIAVADDAKISFLWGTRGEGALAFTTWPSRPLSGRPELLRVGDFDGDQTDDLAFVERGDGTEGRPDAVQVFWGAHSGGPVGPDRVARFRHVDHLETGDFKPPSGEPDGASDLAVTLSDPYPSNGLFGGASGRVMLSPFVLVQGPNVVDLPGNVLVGRFIDHDYPADVIAFGRTLPPVPGSSTSEGDSRLWLIPGAEQARFVSGASFEATLPPGAARAFAFSPPADAAFEPAHAAYAVSDLDGDGLDELVGIDQGSDDRPATLLVARVSGANDPAISTCFAVLPGVMGADDLSLADLDGDDRAELVGTFDVADRVDALVLWDVARHCNEPDGIVTQLPARPDGGAPRSLTILDIDADTSPELAILDERGVYFVEIDAAGEAWLSDTPPVDGLGEQLRTADFNADGLDDLLLSDGRSTRVLLALSHRAAAAR